MGPVARTDYRHITRTEGICGGRPIIAGTRTPVRAIVGYYKLGLSVEEILEGLPHLSPAQVYEALSYYHDHQADIERDLAEAGHLGGLLERYGLDVAADGTLVPKASDEA